MGSGGIPALDRGGGQGQKGVHHSLEAGSVALHQLFVPLAELQGLHHPSRPVVRLPAGILQKDLSPGGLPGVGDALQSEYLTLLLQPALRVGMALDLPPDVQQDLHQAAVAAAVGHGVHQAGKVPTGLQGRIPFLQHLSEHILQEDPGLVLLAEPEIVVQLQPVPLLPEELGAEGVHRGDLGLIDPGGLSAEEGVLRAQGKTLGKLGGNAAPQLGGGSPGVGDDQEPVNVGVLALHSAKEPLHQHPGLARAGGGRHQKLPAPVGDSGLLLPRQLKSHSLPSLFGIIRGPSPPPLRPGGSGRSYGAPPCPGCSPPAGAGSRPSSRRA